MIHREYARSCLRVRGGVALITVVVVNGQCWLVRVDGVRLALRVGLMGGWD